MTDLDTAAAAVNGADLHAQVDELGRQVAVLAWLHAETSHSQQRVAAGLAALLAQQMQPQVQQAILHQLIGR